VDTSSSACCRSRTAAIVRFATAAHAATSSKSKGTAMATLETRITPSTGNLEGVAYLANGSKFVFTADKDGTMWIEKWESFACNGSVKMPAEIVDALKQFLEQRNDHA
jgi:hypothetical protein